MTEDDRAKLEALAQAVIDARHGQLGEEIPSTMSFPGVGALIRPRFVYIQDITRAEHALGREAELVLECVQALDSPAQP
jgi:hypothetical protein